MKVVDGTFQVGGRYGRRCKVKGRRDGRCKVSNFWINRCNQPGLASKISPGSLCLHPLDDADEDDWGAMQLQT